MMPETATCGDRARAVQQRSVVNANEVGVSARGEKCDGDGSLQVGTMMVCMRRRVGELCRHDTWRIMA